MGNGESPKRPHERLDVWQDAMALVETVYRLSKSFPVAERFGLTPQVRRCAVSVPSNIAEGAARRSTAEYLRFLSIARGSLSELDTQMQIAVRLRYLEPAPDFARQVDSVFARLTALMNVLQKSEDAR
jgi:four helix bundle protein